MMSRKQLLSKAYRTTKKSENAKEFFRAEKETESGDVLLKIRITEDEYNKILLNAKIKDKPIAEMIFKKIKGLQIKV